MIDIENYKSAIDWLQRSLARLDREPGNQDVRLSALHSIEVAYNVSESLLRQAYISLGDNEDAAFVSTRELIRQASEDGLVLSSPKQWMQYGLVLESIREAMFLFTDEQHFDLGSLAPSQFALELESFALCLEKRLSAYA